MLKRHHTLPKIVHFFLHVSFTLASVILLILSCHTHLYAAQLTLAWDPPKTGQDPAGYKLYWWWFTSSGRVYPFSVDVGNHTSYTLTEIKEGETYYFAASSYNKDGHESKLSKGLGYGAPLLLAKPFIIHGDETVGLSTDPQNPTAIAENDPLVWQFYCDTTSCGSPCLNIWQYCERGSQQKVIHSAQSNAKWAWVENPALIMGDGIFEFRVAVTDCNEQTAYSRIFYIDTFNIW